VSPSISSSRSASGVEAGGIEVLARGGHHSQAVLGETLVLGEVARLEVLVDRGCDQLRVEVAGGARQQLVRRALDEAPDELPAGLVGHAVGRGHEL
jgi:hypothetical protein